MQMKKFVSRSIKYLFFLLLALSCTSNNRNQELDGSLNDSINNVHLKALVDSTLSQHIGLELDSFGISNSIRNNDTIKEIKGTGRSSLYNYEKLCITGSYKISYNRLSCISLKASHSDVGNVFEIYEKYDTLLTYCMDSIIFSKKNQVYVEWRKEKMDDFFNRVEWAYANRTKVHFGISKEEYNKFGEEFQRNFYEGLIGSGAYELAEPIFRKGKFVGFEIRELHDNSFSYYNVQDNAELVRTRKHGFGANETFWWVYVCELYNMEIMSRYDKFDRKDVKSLKAYWNEWVKLYN